jgi:hypothetical protein
MDGRERVCPGMDLCCGGHGWPGAAIACKACLAKVAQKPTWYYGIILAPALSMTSGKYFAYDPSIVMIAVPSARQARLGWALAGVSFR